MPHAQTIVASLIASPQRRPEPRSVDSRALLGGTREVLIEHNGEHYRLRLTRAGKLILTK